MKAQIARGAAVVSALALSLLACRHPPSSQSPSQERPTLEPREALALGMRIVPSTRSKVEEMTASAQTWPSYQVTEQGIVFFIALDGTDTIRYIRTSDVSFVTAEGIRVGSTLEAVRRAGAPAPIPEPGWASHTLLPSGWHAAFIEGAGIGEDQLSASSRVKWLFKRR